ncbi:Dna2/Cas4 domain-containing protein [Soehngenia longivitae]
MYYYIVCKIKLWYYTHNLNMEQNSELVEIGHLINDNSYI